MDEPPTVSPDLIQCIFFLLILSLCIIEKRVMPMRDTSPMLVNNDYRAPPTRPARPARRPHAPNPCCAGRPVGEDLRSGPDVPVVHSQGCGVVAKIVLMTPLATMKIPRTCWEPLSVGTKSLPQLPSLVALALGRFKPGRLSLSTTASSTTFRKWDYSETNCITFHLYGANRKCSLHIQIKEVFLSRGINN